MSVNSKTNQNQKDENSVESPLHNADALMSISGHAKFLSWVMLAFSAVSLVVAIILDNRIFQNYPSGLGNSIYYLLSLIPFLIGLSLYIILRFVSESILFFLELEIDIKDIGKKRR